MSQMRLKVSKIVPRDRNRKEVKKLIGNDTHVWCEVIKIIILDNFPYVMVELSRGLWVNAEYDGLDYPPEKF